MFILPHIQGGSSPCSHGPPKALDGMWILTRFCARSDRAYSLAASSHGDQQLRPSLSQHPAFSPWSGCLCQPTKHFLALFLDSLLEHDSYHILCVSWASVTCMLLLSFSAPHLTSAVFNACSFLLAVEYVPRKIRISGCENTRVCFFCWCDRTLAKKTILGEEKVNFHLQAMVIIKGS